MALSRKSVAAAPRRSGADAQRLVEWTGGGESGGACEDGVLDADAQHVATVRLRYVVEPPSLRVAHGVVDRTAANDVPIGMIAKQASHGGQQVGRIPAVIVGKAHVASGCKRQTGVASARRAP